MQTAFVTGVTSGYGRAIAIRMVHEGYRVIGVGRRAERLAELAEQLGDAFYPLELDITNASAVSKILDVLPPAWRHVDIVVNNAGLALGIEPAQRATLADWDSMIATNISALTAITHLFLPMMVEHNRGAIVFLGSIAANYAYRGGNVYGATKAFVAQFAKNLRTDLLGSAVKITTIEPGLSGGSEFSLVRLKDRTKADAVYQGVCPLIPEDIAETVAWVLSLPPHVNINTIELMPVCQAAGGLEIQRNT